MDNAPEVALSYADLYLVPWGIKIGLALAIFFIGRLAARWLVRLSERLMRKGGMDDMLVHFLGNIASALLLAFVVLAALDQLGVNTTSALAVLGAAGLAVGLALQGSLANLASGVLLIIFRPFEVDDFVCIAGEEGFVEKIHIFTTQIRTFDNRTIIVPNSTITSGKIINYTAKEIRRVDLSIGISYGANIKKAMDAITDLCSSNPKVLKDPAPYVGVIEYGDSSINLTVRPWCKTGDYWDVFFAINEQMKPALDNKGITIPFPQRDVHLFQHKD